MQLPVPQRNDSSDTSYTAQWVWRVETSQGQLFHIDASLVKWTTICFNVILVDGAILESIVRGSHTALTVFVMPIAPCRMCSKNNNSVTTSDGRRSTTTARSHPLVIPCHYFNAEPPRQRCLQEVIPESPPQANPNGTLIPTQDASPKKRVPKSAKTNRTLALKQCALIDLHPVRLLHVNPNGTL